jgi:hypothetical protein
MNNNYSRGSGSRNDGIKMGRTKTPTLGSRKQSTAGVSHYSGTGVWPRTQTAQGQRKRNQPAAVYMTFKQMREQQRIAEQANVGPGTTEYLKPFGSEVKNKMHFQGRPKKYNNMFHFESNPNTGPGSTNYSKPFGSDV